MRYAELHALSNFSFLRGASHPEAMYARARELGLHSLALTDRDGLYGAVRFWKAYEKARDGQADPPPELPKYEGDGPYGSSARAHARAKSIAHAGSTAPLTRPIYGSELTLVDGSRVVVLVRDREGWRNLSALITESRMACEKGQVALPFQRLVDRRAGLFILSGGRFGPVDRSLLGIDGLSAGADWKPKGAWGRNLGGVHDRKPVEGPTATELALFRARDDLTAAARVRPDFAARRRRAVESAARFRDAFGESFFLEVQDHQLPEDTWLRALLGELGEELGIPRVATNFAHYARPEERRLQDVVSSVRLRVPLHQAGTRLLPNGRFHLRSASEMAALFSHDPAAVGITVELAEACSFDLSDIPYAFPVAAVPAGHTLQTRLEELTWEGASVRYGERLDTDPRIRGQLRHELDVVGRMGLAGYFLIVQDIAEECRRRGILAQGRGSAANSCVCYCLRITAVDPIRLELLFERFLSEARGGWPDIDIDIANTKREEILQYVYDKYGREKAAMVCNVITYHPRSAIRDVGKAFGLGLDQVDRMAKALSHYSGTDELLELFGEGGSEAVSEDARLVKQVLDYTKRLCGFPRHIGIHSGGVVVSGLPIGEACPVENAAMVDRTVLQWDKDDVAHTGLVKIDLLALGMLSVIQEAGRLLAGVGRPFDMAQLDCADARVFDMICEADTVGLFQIESRAQMNTLPRLRPRTFHDLVVEVALIRPGPIQGDMVHPYLRRRQGKEPVTYAHPSLRPILERTLGIPLFQEQAMKMAITAAGFTPGEADRLRKVMGFKRATDEMEELFDKMVGGMEANGFAPEVARDVRNQLRGFAAYGFPESHAASFALIVYASGWLKCYEPAGFFAGLLNCQPMGFYTPATLTADARRHGVTIEPVCVNASDWRWVLEGEGGLRAGLLQVQGLSEEEGLGIEDARALGGAFHSVTDFCERADLPRDKLESLAEAGAFSDFGLDRRQALWAVAGWRRRLPLEGCVSERRVPVFPKLTGAQLTLLDHAVAGFSPSEHPLTRLRPELARRGLLTAADLSGLKHNARIRTSGIVITRQRPGTAKGVFFITLEDESGFSNIIVWPDLFEAHSRLLRRVRFLEVRGRIQREDNVVNVLAIGFRDLERDGVALGMDFDAVRSRDFR